MYICDECGDVKYESEFETFDNSDCGGSSTEIELNCRCGGYFEEVIKPNNCEYCGEYSINKICPDCLEEQATLDNAYKLGAVSRENIEINYYLLREFSQSQIESILYNNLKAAEKLGLSLNFKEYCLEDKYQFEEFLISEKD